MYIAGYHQALRLKPGFVAADNNLGIALAEKDNMDGAMAEFREALRLKPDDANAHANLGHGLQAKGNRREALGEYRKACQLAPNHPDYCSMAEKLSREPKQP